MAIRTTSSNVKGILGSHYDSQGGPDLDPFIATATVIVDLVASNATDRMLTIASAHLEIIERWLSAHFYALSDPLYSSRSTDGASGSFQGQTGMGLDSTTYGQTAKRLDTTGFLAGMDSTAGVPRMEWLGKTQNEALTWQERN